MNTVSTYYDIHWRAAKHEISAGHRELCIHDGHLRRTVSSDELPVHINLKSEYHAGSILMSR